MQDVDPWALWLLAMSGQTINIDARILLLQDALALLPGRHPDRSLALVNLGVTLQMRFEQEGNRSDLEIGRAHV